MTVSSAPTPPGDRELVITRIFDAPRELVFSVWTRPEQVTRWWGPNDFTLPVCEMDFRVGGSYKYCMRSPEGEDHWVWGEYREIAEPERIVFTWERKDLQGNLRSNSVVTATFEETEGKRDLLCTRESLNLPKMRQNITAAGQSA
jgi:uncharacterized protein YndB with AHSA1/START domain